MDSGNLHAYPSLRDQPGWLGPACSNTLNLSICVLGASGDLAKKKTYPALLQLFTKGFLPPRTQIVGYARTAMSVQELHERLRPHLQGAGVEAAEVARFLQLCTYMHGDYAAPEGYQALGRMLTQWEGHHEEGCSPLVGRLFYLALPPTVYPEVCAGLKHHVGELYAGARPAKSWIRIICEKPFGMDLASSEVLAGQIGALWPEDNLYRIDHYLGKELIENLTVLRFSNLVFEPLWTRQYIRNVQVIFSENFGTEGRGGYFDQYGIIRDVIQNHLIQVVALLAMESPVSLHPDDIRDEKVKLLRAVAAARVEECVLGQYVGAGGNPGYLEDPTVPRGSRTPTFASVRLHINNDRWAGVPFVIKAGKALNERTALVRVQLKTPASSLFGDHLAHLRNELVIRFQPGEAIYTKLVVKKPGLEMDYVMSELDLTYPERYKDVSIPDAYERLILDCIRGDQQHFVRRDELRAAWAIFTPLLHAIDGARGPPLHNYPYGSRGPAEADRLVADSGYTKTHYHWQSYEQRRSVDGGKAERKSGDGGGADGGDGAAGGSSGKGVGGSTHSTHSTHSHRHHRLHLQAHAPTHEGGPGASGAEAEEGAGGPGSNNGSSASQSASASEAESPSRAGAVGGRRAGSGFTGGGGGNGAGGGGGGEAGVWRATAPSTVPEPAGKL